MQVKCSEEITPIAKITGINIRTPLVEMHSMRKWVIAAVVLLASAAHAQDSTQEKLAHLQNLRDDAVHCLRSALRDARGNRHAQKRLVAECQKAFIKAIDDPSIKGIWAQFVFVEEEVGPLWWSALAEAKARGPAR
jgi:hypothetical protein